MTQIQLTSRVAASALDAHPLAAGFLGEQPAFILADGMMARPGADEPLSRLHQDGTLVAQFQHGAVITGGEDGVVNRIAKDGGVTQLAAETGRWIDAVAMGPDGVSAWAIGKSITARDGKGRHRRWQAPTTPVSMAFLPKGYRLALPHYNGASLWFPATEAPPEPLPWKGSHIDITASPDGRYIVTSMQENALHGWRITDKAHMRMTGYPAKTRSMSWSHDGNWLATSGAEAAIIWPFSGKDGPMGKAPRECGVRPKRVSAVAFHPSALVLAVGFEDGFVMLIRLTDASELPVRVPSAKAGGITSLAWDARGSRLAIAGSDGYAGVLTLP
jgi:WD40 repeat protein